MNTRIHGPTTNNTECVFNFRRTHKVDADTIAGDVGHPGTG